ncbi:MAG: serine hydrolase domain-containing protein [Pseudomonadota bacterium]
MTSVWDAVDDQFLQIAFPDAALIIGDANGVLHRVEKGLLRTETNVRSASSAKMLGGLTLLSLVESGDLGLADHPQAYLTFWTSEPADPRSQITLSQLLGFTSGLNYSPSTSGCINDPDTTIQACAEEFFQRGISGNPGEAFFYGPGHLQVAAAMAEASTGTAFAALFRERIGDPLGLDEGFSFGTPSVTNPRVAGGATINGEDFASILRAVLAGELLTDLDQLTADRTANVIFASRPASVEQRGVDWHYAAGAWLECDDAPFTDDCAQNPILSSPGAFGVTPWIDFSAGYFAIIIAEEPFGGGTSPAAESVAIEQLLQPLIIEALAELD